ncbi:MAG: DUF1499 domain-containing protein [Comamonadaceae bacterium]|nr:DUF1499 domain-containing protein [Comamonadaceae bacterium]
MKRSADEPRASRRALAVLAAGGCCCSSPGRPGWLAGAAPDDLGVRDGRLKPPSRDAQLASAARPTCTPAPARWWTTRASRRWPAGGDLAATMARLRAVDRGDARRAHRRAARPDYLYAQFTHALAEVRRRRRVLGRPAEGVIHVRSASRLGRKDFGVNRAADRGVAHGGERLTLTPCSEPRADKLPEPFASAAGAHARTHRLVHGAQMARHRAGRVVRAGGADRRSAGVLKIRSTPGSIPICFRPPRAARCCRRR